jgi:protein tyrosine phosphatase (PTP) superfamily phosphohydrolase (DUF442 family)
MLSDIKNFYYFTDLIAVSRQPTEAQLHDIQEAGYKVVINLGLHDNPKYSLPDDRGTVEVLGMTYIHIPVQFGHPTRQDLDAFFRAMKANKSRKVYVHCAMNYRGSAFMELYLRIKSKLPHEQAFVLMCKIWEPDKVWAGFIADALKTYGIRD